MPCRVDASRDVSPSLADVSARARRFVLAGIVFAALAGCAENTRTEVVPSTESLTVTPTPTPTPTERPTVTCDEPARSQMDVLVDNAHFSVKCLTVPADVPLKIEFVNADFVDHNLSIYAHDHSSAFTGDVAFPAERFTFVVPALDAGEYLFQCDIHPSLMFGPLIAR